MLTQGQRVVARATEEKRFGTGECPVEYGRRMDRKGEAMTSVKDIEVVEPPADGDLGRGTFTFSDRYSVFDWGPMPDTIPGKGASLCTMGAFNFELFADAGIPTHYRGVIPPEGDDPTSIANCESPPTVMAIDLAMVPELPETGDGYDYETFHQEAGESFVVPLEVIFRNRVPIGSSLRRRLEPADVGLSYSTWPDEPIELDDPIVEFSTKFEQSDRYLKAEEAAAIAGVASLESIEELAHGVNEIITEQATATGLRHDDGKIEVVYHAGDHLVADVAGTFDENRFTQEGQQLSKEVIRQFYKRFHPEWTDAVSLAKQEAKEADRHDWKAFCEIDPKPLPEAVIEAVSIMYTAGADTYTELGLFGGEELPAVLDHLDPVLHPG